MQHGWLLHCKSVKQRVAGVGGRGWMSGRHHQPAIDASRTRLSPHIHTLHHPSTEHLRAAGPHTFTPFITHPRSTCVLPVPTHSHPSSPACCQCQTTSLCHVYLVVISSNKTADSRDSTCWPVYFRSISPSLPDKCQCQSQCLSVCPQKVFFQFETNVVHR